MIRRTRAPSWLAGALIPAALAYGQKPAADLQGIWTNATLTPLERPPQLVGKATMTAEEAAAYVKQIREQGNRDRRGGNLGQPSPELRGP